MFKDFDVVKGQLAELAEAVNKFKSEAVQLRLLELLFADGVAPSGEQAKPLGGDTQGTGKPRRKVRRKASAKTAEQPVDQGGRPAKKSVASGNGAVATLTRLHADTDFFKTPRAIKDILQHCETNLARRIKANEISGKLGRMVRTGELKRQKNKDSQYEYTKP